MRSATVGVYARRHLLTSLAFGTFLSGTLSFDGYSRERKIITSLQRSWFNCFGITITNRFKLVTEHRYKAAFSTRGCAVRGANSVTTLSEAKYY